MKYIPTIDNRQEGGIYGLYCLQKNIALHFAWQQYFASDNIDPNILQNVGYICYVSYQYRSTHNYGIMQVTASICAIYR